MATYVPAKKNTAFITYVGLPSQANALTLQANPTLAAGDVKVAIDDGAPANLATIPAVDADFTKRVKVSLSTSEMNGDNITVIFSDAAGAEWCDVLINIQTAAKQIDDIKAETALIVADTDLIDDATSGLAKIASDVDAILTDTSSTLDTLIKDIPTTAELALRTLLAAEYTVVSDLGTVQSGDSFAIVNGVHGLVSIQDDIDEILIDTGSTLDTLIKDIPTTAELALRTLLAAEYTVVADLGTVQSGDSYARIGAAGISLTAITDAITALENVSTAEVNTQVDAALNTAIPGAPTADSINDYIQQLKYVLVNLMAITEASGNVVGYADDDVTPAYTVAAAFTTAAGITTRKRLE